jgi:hypothetical protein
MCGKHITEDQFRQAFEGYGTIEEVWVLKDRVTQEPKVSFGLKNCKMSVTVLSIAN